MKFPVKRRKTLARQRKGDNLFDQFQQKTAAATATIANADTVALPTQTTAQVTCVMQNQFFEETQGGSELQKDFSGKCVQS